MRTPYVVGNWKMNTARSEASELATAVGATATRFAGKVDVGVAPPFVWLADIGPKSAAALGVLAQNCNANPSGAHTGEVALPMLAELGVGAVILGHSERRHVYGETDADIAAKVSAARAAGFGVILCVGETLEERDAGRTWEVVRGQLEGGLEAGTEADGITVAYEPVWAIGTGRTATPDQAQEVHASIRNWWTAQFGADAGAALRIQYGGSVKPGNAAELLAMPDIDGALVGGASLRAADFAAIIEAAAG